MVKRMNKYAILAFKDHIWSNIVIDNLLNNVHHPLVIIEEESNFGNKKKNFYLELLSDSKEKIIKKEIKIISEKYKIDYFCVKNHNDEETLEILKKYDLDIILLANTRIIKPNIYQNAKLGAFNCHPDKLPGYRGSVVFLRRILENLPIGVTCHWVNEIVDTGSIAYYNDVNYKIGDKLGDIVYKIIQISSHHFINLLNDSKIPKINQNITNTPCFKFPDETIIDECRKKLDLKKNLIN